MMLNYYSPYVKSGFFVLLHCFLLGQYMLLSNLGVFTLPERNWFTSKLYGYNLITKTYVLVGLDIIKDLSFYHPSLVCMSVCNQTNSPKRPMVKFIPSPLTHCFWMSSRFLSGHICMLSNYPLL